MNAFRMNYHAYDNDNEDADDEDLDEGDAVLLAERRHELLVHRLVTVVRQDTQQRLPAGQQYLYFVLFICLFIFIFGLLGTSCRAPWPPP